MNVTTTARTNGSGTVERVDILANGTRITVADAPGDAIHVTVTGPDGGPIVDVTIRRGPVGPEGVD